MIEFLIMQICLVASNGYDCDWQLELGPRYSVISAEQDNKKIYIIFSPFKDWTGPEYLWNSIIVAKNWVDG